MGKGKNKMSTVVKTPKFRANFPALFKMQKNKLSGKDEYTLTALFPKGTDLSSLKSAARAAAEDKWGKDQSKWPKLLKMPFRDQKESANNEGVLPVGHEEGAIFMTFKSQQKPGVVDHNVNEIIDESQIYSGCWCVATVRPYAFDNGGNRGIAFGLGNVQKVGDGEPLGGRTRAQDDFAPIENPDAKSANDLFD